MWLIITKLRSESLVLAMECHHYNGWNGHQAPSLKRTSCPKRFQNNARHMLRCVFIVECVIAWFLCAMHVFKVPALPLCQILFVSRPPLLSKPMGKIAYSITHSLTQPLSLFDAPWTRAFASEQCVHSHNGKHMPIHRYKLSVCLKHWTLSYWSGQVYKFNSYGQNSVALGLHVLSSTNMIPTHPRKNLFPVPFDPHLYSNRQNMASIVTNNILLI